MPTPLHRSVILGLLLFRPAAALPAALVVEDFAGPPLTNALGGRWIPYTDGYSALELIPGLKPGLGGGESCLGLSFRFRPGAPHPYAGALTSFNAAFSPLDISAYRGLRFWAQGGGAWQVSVATAATASANNHYASRFSPQAEGGPIEVPFSALSQLWGPAAAWDPAHAVSVAFSPEGPPPDSGGMRLGRLELYQAGEERVPAAPAFTSPRPKANQVGYLCGDSKGFSVVTSTAAAGAPFSVVDSSGNTAFRGSLSRAYDDTPSSGEWVARGDFSGLKIPGSYTVLAGGQASQPFRVGPSVYDGLWKDALRCFYLIRCGVAIDDGATGIRHGACHRVHRTDSDPALDRDFSGGWHNAGDFGRWTHEEAYACSHLLWLAQWRPDLARNPPPGDPGLLKEARWGLEWLLKMLNPDGSVLHKVDSEPEFAAGKGPDQDPTLSLARYAGRYSTIDAADLSAVMAQAAGAYRSSDPAFAGRCAAASASAWAWAQAHPNLGSTDPYYTDPTPWRATLWAECERYRLTRDPGLKADLERRLPEHPLTVETWMDPQLLGYFALAFGPQGEAADPLGALAAGRIRAYADELEARQDASGYRVWLEPGQYYWGSIALVLGAGNVYCAADRLSGLDRYRQDALRALDNVLGVNALDHSHAALYGARSNRKPYHWAYLSSGKVLPAWLSEGPNAHPEGADPGLAALIRAGTPPAKCFLDDGTSWASDEGTTDIQAAFVLLCGYFHSGPPL